MSRNLAWTSALGDACVNQQAEVLDAIQAMRRRAQTAGYLERTPQQDVISEGQTIVIEPADSENVYVPQYDPWLAYGPPLVAYRGWAPPPGMYLNGPGVMFCAGAGLGLLATAWGLAPLGCRLARPQADARLCCLGSVANNDRGAALSRRTISRVHHLVHDRPRQHACSGRFVAQLQDDGASVDRSFGRYPLLGTVRQNRQPSLLTRLHEHHVHQRAQRFLLRDRAGHRLRDLDHGHEIELFHRHIDRGGIKALR